MVGLQRTGGNGRALETGDFHPRVSHQHLTAQTQLSASLRQLSRKQRLTRERHVFREVRRLADNQSG